ncbi:baculoviral IAP repeat-containing protein 5 [Anoplophora glabripennis]|nr:baculoviral IAP repeat-containing protein 5 [Anoplophora glabripennis]
MEELYKSFDFLIEENRRKTFKKWVFSDRDICNADKMAEAGFVFIGDKTEPDAVKCFLCNKLLDGWEATDDPWLEHLKHAPKCLFAKFQKAQGNLTLSQLIDVVDALTEQIITLYFDKIGDEVEQKFEEYEQKIMSMLQAL